jgi:hypothetical protein
MHIQYLLRTLLIYIVDIDNIDDNGGSQNIFQKGTTVT